MILDSFNALLLILKSRGVPRRGPNKVYNVYTVHSVQNLQSMPVGRNMGLYDASHGYQRFIKCHKMMYIRMFFQVSDVCAECKQRIG